MAGVRISQLSPLGVPMPHYGSFLDKFGTEPEEPAAPEGQWFYGGSHATVVTTTYQLPARGQRFLVVAPSPSAVVNLSKATRHKPGGPVHVIGNVSASEDVTVKDFDGSTLGAVGAESAREFWLRNNSTDAGVWVLTPDRPFVLGSAI